MQSINLVNKNYWVYAIISLFILINTILIYFEFFYFSAVVLVLAIAFIAFTRLDNLLYLIVFLTPVSIPLRFLIRGIENDIILPTEPLILVVLFIFIAKLIYEKKFDRKILFHPITMVILLNLTWIFLTSITSSMPMVSFKYLLSRIWFLVAFYFLMSQLFRNYKNFNKFFWMYIIPLLGVIFYTVIRLSKYGITNQIAANFAPKPLFNDHTAYGASLAMIYPVVLYLFIQKNKSLLYRVITFLVLLIYTAAVIISYTRATWISLIAGMIVFLIIKFRIKFKYLILTSTIATVVIVGSWESILMKLEKNKTESSDYLIEHVESISNVSSDASNLERINRWSCAIRMFKEKPIFGWGPGTYRFKYAPFQLSYQKTPISTNAGILGNAHSEYIGPLSEMGILGAVTFLLIIIFTLTYGIKLYYRTKDTQTKQMIMALLIGLITYYIHGTLNNFLDTDKASCLFWGFTAALVSIEIYHQDKIRMNSD